MRNYGINISKSDFNITEFNFKYKKKEGFSLIEVIYCGVCGSDLHRINDENFIQKNYLGHEIVGKVISSYNKKLIGKYVVVNPLIPCNKCDYCNKGLTNLCNKISGIGRNLNGGFLKYISVKNENIYLLDLEKEFLELGVFVDSIAVVFHGIKLLGNINKIKNILIIGDGTIGLISAYILKKKYNLNIIIAYRNYKNKFLNFNDFSFVDIKELKKDKNFDLVIETVGKGQSETINISIDRVKNNGKILVFGVFPENYFGEINLRKLFYKEINLIGSNSFIVNNDYNDFKEALNFLYNNKKFFNLLINNIFYFKNISLSLVNNKEKGFKNILKYNSN